MRKIDKFIARLAKEEREKILAALRRIQGRDFSGFDMKKLGGFSHFYRIRIGKFRIIFEMQKERGGQGPARRQGLEYAENTKGVKVICETEPEKISIVTDCIRIASFPILNNQV